MSNKSGDTVQESEEEELTHTAQFRKPLNVSFLGTCGIIFRTKGINTHVRKHQFFPKGLSIHTHVYKIQNHQIPLTLRARIEFEIM